MTSKEILQNIRNAAIDASFRTYTTPLLDLRSWLSRLWSLLFQVDSRDEGHYRFQYSAQQLYFLLALTEGAIALISFSQDYNGLFAIGIIGMTVFMGSMILNKQGLDQAALWLSFFGINLFSAIYTLGLGWSSGFYFHLLIVGPLLFLHPGGQMRLKIVLTLFSALHMALLNELIVNTYRWDLLPIQWMTLLHYGNVIATYAILAYFTFAYHHAANQSEARLRESSDKWQHLASRDMLTGIYNRRAMSEVLDDEVSRVNRGDRPFSLALVDIDHFKNINDTYGHQTGDDVIRNIAQRMASFFRHHDLVARWGGEEFLILFPETGAHQAANALDKLRKQINASPVLSEGREISVAVTIGLAQFEPQQGLDKTIQFADEALYHGKQRGRNRVILHEL